MLDITLNSLAPISFVFEILALLLGFYLKNSRVFFIACAFLCARLTYIYAPILQAHLFVSLLLPFVFMLFVVMKKSVLVFDKKSLSKVAVLGIAGLLALILSKSTNFSYDMEKRLFELGFSPLSDLSFVFFAVEFVFLCVWAFFKREFCFLIAFFLGFVQFLFKNLAEFSFFEFSSLFLVLYLFYDSYKSLYFNALTKLPNEKALKRRLLGLNDFHILAFKIQVNEPLNARQEHIFYKQITRILKRQNKQIFFANEAFVFIFENSNEIQENLQNLQQKLQNLKLKEKTLNLKFSSISFKNKANFEDNLNAIKDGLKA